MELNESFFTHSGTLWKNKNRETLLVITSHRRIIIIIIIFLVLVQLYSRNMSVTEILSRFDPRHLCCETKLLRRRRQGLGISHSMTHRLLFRKGACAQNQKSKTERENEIETGSRRGDGLRIRKYIAAEGRGVDTQPVATGSRG